jgi:hypothetical protein
VPVDRAEYSPQDRPLPKWLSREVQDMLLRAHRRAVAEDRTVLIQVVLDDVWAVMTYRETPPPPLSLWARIRKAVNVR